MKTEEILFADVILALHLPYSYTYRVPKELQSKIMTGQRVAVQLRNRIYSGIVVNLTNEIPKTTALKYILDIVDLQPVVTDKQIEFFKWVADYYIAYIGDVLSAAMPASLRLKSETIVTVSPYFNSDISNLDENELKIFNLVVSKEKISLEDIKANLNSKDVIKIIHKLITKDVLITDEELLSRYSPKKETFISLNDKFKDKNELKTLLDELDKSKRTQPQCEVILKYLALSQGRGVCKKSELEESGCNPNTITTLLKKDILVRQSFEISRLKNNTKKENVSSICLNGQQQSVFDKIIDDWDKTSVSLIHGVTGSGKTEIYIKLIDKVINENNTEEKEINQVLYLLPELAITEQLIKRLEKYFGGEVVAYNSKFSTVERAEIWHRTMTNDPNKKFKIILGSRSSVFLPFTNLKLVIIDEEHDTAFKQTEPVPHYNGRDCALYLAKLFNAKTILGSATPNVETYKLASEGKYQLLELNKQYFDLPLPTIELVDMRQAIREKTMQGIFSQRLIEEINIALNDNKQVIIFQNRRGYAPHIECNVCGFVPKCPNCDVSLVLHKDKQDLECHYCGYHTNAVSYCPQCQSHSMRLVGTGTQKIEEELQIYFPSAKIKRMDLDSTRTKDAYTEIISDFAAHKTDILCGTQIITKGLDFENVSLVGVLGTDSMLHYPDFRSFERTFQILTQVSGRAGRKHKEGKVLIQTFESQHPIMQDVINRNYEHMYKMQLKERQLMNFPPYCKMIKLTLQHKDREFIASKSREYALNLREIFGTRLFGPQEPVIARIKNLYSMEIWLKIEKNISYSAAKLHLRQYNEEFLAQRTNSQIRISIDVDPV
ncbi:MAG: primosomal protein N' [Bacteroidales bacterium]|nr:primosomal protein N' [Bacteroidales bacterium]